MLGLGGVKDQDGRFTPSPVRHEAQQVSQGLISGDKHLDFKSPRALPGKGGPAVDHQEVDLELAPRVALSEYKLVVDETAAGADQVPMAMKRRASEADAANTARRDSFLAKNNAVFHERSFRLAQVIDKTKQLPPKPPTAKEANKFKNDLAINEHILSLPEVEKKLETNLASGLASDEAKIRLARDGPNMLKPPKQTPEIIKFLLAMVDGFAPLLWAGALLCLLVYIADPTDKANLYLGIVLILVIVIGGSFGYSQEAHSSRLMDGFRKLLPQMATVTRDGKQMKLAATELVIGDVVTVCGGDKVPADIRIVECGTLKVDNSSLTGESEPQKRGVQKTSDYYWETANIAFYGTSVTEGQAKGVVFATGDHTMIGRIAKNASEEKKPDTLMKQDINRFIFIITIIAAVLGLSFMTVSFAKGDEWVRAVVFGIGIVVANVPEGLLVTITVSLALTAKRMAKKNVLVKNMQTVETLGAVTVIASDKTGTLTQNRMTVTCVYLDGERRSANRALAGAVHMGSPAFRELNRVMTLCNRAVFTADNDPLQPVSLWKTIGDASESAILKYVHDLHDVNSYRQRHPKVAEVPFNSVNKYQLSVHQLPAKLQGEQKQADGSASDVKMLRRVSEKQLVMSGREADTEWRKKVEEELAVSEHVARSEIDTGYTHIIVFKGAPERVLAHCTHIRSGDSIREMMPADNEAVDKAGIALAKQGHRVLGFAQGLRKLPPGFTPDLDTPGSFPYGDLTFIGLVSLSDPPREEVPKAVEQCHRAGIKVVMVTGDHPATAESIARQVGILTDETLEQRAERLGCPASQIDKSTIKAAVVNGSTLAALEEDEWRWLLSREQLVFARTLPQHKQKIVASLQKYEKAVVAVTGDGVNDSPALKKADVGIAMGKTGSEVAKEVADMILLDDNFASIVKGVEEGRLIFDNLKKAIAFTLSANMPQILPFLVAVSFGLPLPLDTVHILIIDFGTDLLPGTSLAYERPEQDIMQRPPRNRFSDRLVTARVIGFAYVQIGLLQALFGFLSYYMVMYYAGYGLSDIAHTDHTWRDDTVPLVLGMTYGQRMDLLHRAQTAYLVTVMVSQMADVIICKTRIFSVFQLGMQNKVINLAVVQILLLAFVLVYVPVFHPVFSLQPLSAEEWWPMLPCFFVIFFYDEARKWFVRRDIKGWVSWLSYY